MIPVYNNGLSLKNFDIAICIPTKNEEDTISNIVSIIDEGLNRYYPTQRAIILNVDSKSTDDTRKLFLEHQTRSNKYSIVCDNPNYQGKGANLLQFFHYCNLWKIKAAATIDADLKSITPEGIKSILDPVLNQSIDFVSPLYSRHKYDATITNQICVPLLSLIFGCSIRQPIGGEFGFSGLFIKSLFSNIEERKQNGNLPLEYINRFGIDILITTHALIYDSTICQSFLGKKIHTYRAPSNLSLMFYDVVSTLFAQIKLKLNETKKETKIVNVPFVFSQIDSCSCDTEVNIEEVRSLAILEYSTLNENAKCLVAKSLGLDNIKQTEDFFINSYVVDEKWMKILTFSINSMLEKDISPINIAKFLYPIFVLKVYSHFYRIENLSDETAELLVQKQALLFYENRKNIFDSLKIGG